jgi:hypothetical protein
MKFVSLIYDNEYRTKCFVSVDENKIEDLSSEMIYKSNLEQFIKNNEICVFDIKSFTKFLHKNEIDVLPYIYSIQCLQLLWHLDDCEHNINLKISTNSTNSKLIELEKRVDSFKRIYGTRWTYLAPHFILRNYCVFSSQEMQDLFKVFTIDSYYEEVKEQLVYLTMCELNGINTINNNFIFPEYHYDHSRTGRLMIESNEHISQNLKKDDAARKKYISRFENGRLLHADWDSMDFRVALAISKEHINTLNLHTDIAKLVLNKEDISEQERAKIKIINFSILYSSSINTISEKLGISKEEIKVTINKIFEKFPNLKETVKQSVINVLREGFAKSYFGRKRLLDKSEYTKFFNSVVQTTSSGICLRAIKFIQTELNKNNLKSKLIPYIVFDKVCVDTFPGEEQQVELAIRNAMEVLAPGDLSNFVNFPIKIEYKETL